MGGPLHGKLIRVPTVVQVEVDGVTYYYGIDGRYRPEYSR